MQSLKCVDSPIIRSAYSKKSRVQVHFTGKGRTKQSFKAECDINTIISRFMRTGVLDFANKNQPRYGDTTGLEYQGAMQIVAGAKSLFNELPAALRDRFDNEPALFLDFVQDERNREEAQALGLLKPVAAGEPLPPSHREDGSASHEPLRAADGTFREHTRSEKRAEVKAQKAADAADKTNSTT